jgi:Asp-tRNA(Asn)/Glu-tRNA(Gln) amidotransferase A subunit family amidase
MRGRGPMARNVYDVAAMLSVISAWDAEDLMTFHGIGYFPDRDWSKALAASDLACKRIGVLRENDLYRSAASGRSRDPRARARGHAQSREAIVVDPVLTGIDLKNQTLGDYTNTSRYEQLHFQNAYLARLGNATK